MTNYYNDLKVFFQQAGKFNTPVVLHVEPDLWAYLQRACDIDSAPTVSVKVASTGIEELQGLPENATGFAEAIVRLRNKFAANVLLAYHLSTWGTGEDPSYSNPSDDRVRWLANRSAAFYHSLRTEFDLVFAEFSDRDAAFKDKIYGDHGASWWDPSDYARNVVYLQTFIAATRKRLVIWQIPFGNTKMRAENNTWNHFQDNKVEWLLDDPSRSHLEAYVRAGVIAFLFGRGADGATCACDTGDGVTNPPPINGNVMESLNSDDDGGFFHERAAAYYNTGVIPLAGR